MNPLEELKSKIKDIEKQLNYKFKNKDLLILAFVHRSFVNEYRDLMKEHNERLEFLGDSVLGLVIADFLYKTLSTSSEGKLSSIRASLVDANACSTYLKKLNIEECVLLGKGEKQTSERGRDTIFSDVFEAIVAAIYLDGGYKKANDFILKRLKDEIENILKNPIRNFKAELQDYSQKKYQKIPNYRVIKESGPDHEKMFDIGVYIDEELLGEGQGLSKKDAEQKAAKNALEKINESI